MAIRELAKEALWVSYILFLVTIVLIPVARNVYCIIKYKMSFSKYSRKIIDSFLEKNTCIYATKFQDYRGVFLFFASLYLVIITPYVISSRDEYNQYLFLFFAAVFIFLHISWIYHFISYLYDACYMTNTSMLIRGFHTACSFKIIQAHDIERYRIDNFYAPDKFFHLINVIQNLTIVTKYSKIFSLHYLGNREELIDALKSFTNSFEEK